MVKKLAIAQVILGVSVIGYLLSWVNWISPGYHIHEGLIPGTDMILHCMGFLMPKPLLTAWVFVFLALGLAVTGCGMLQYFETRRQAKDKENGEGDSGVMEV